uniref:Uncharacterized protein n=1 Tax=Acrobeloides nanus TaxID=290746 RepID=A0A914E6U0_9BILA
MGDSLIEVPSFERFKEKLHIELLADVRGHTLEKLSANLSSDENWHLGIVARAYGFPTFETLLQSPQLADIVILSKERRNGREVMIYKGVQLPEIDHITKQMSVTDGDVQHKQVIEAEQKVLRATLAQYDPTCMKGKTQIFKILSELGGNPKELGGQPIPYQKVQDRYEQVYNTKLNPDELKKYFKKTKAQSVFEQLCFEEVTVFNDQQQPGSMFLQLKKPFEELESEWKSKAEIQCAGYNHINAMKLALQQQREEELRNKRPKKESKCNLATRNLVPTISGIPTNMMMSKHLAASNPSMNPFMLPDSAFGPRDFLPISKPAIDEVDNKVASFLPDTTTGITHSSIYTAEASVNKLQEQEPAQQWTSVGDGEYTDEEDFAAPPTNLVDNKKTRPSEIPKTDLAIKENELSYEFIQPNTSPSNVALNSNLYHEPEAVNVKHAEETVNQMKKSSMTRVMKMAMQHVREMDQQREALSRNQTAYSGRFIDKPSSTEPSPTKSRVEQKMEELRLAEEQQREANRRQEEESRKAQKLAQSRLDMDTNIQLPEAAATRSYFPQNSTIEAAHSRLNSYPGQENTFEEILEKRQKVLDAQAEMFGYRNEEALQEFSGNANYYAPAYRNDVEESRSVAGYPNVLRSETFNGRRVVPEYQNGFGNSSSATGREVPEYGMQQSSAHLTSRSQNNVGIALHSGRGGNMSTYQNRTGMELTNQRILPEYPNRHGMEETSIGRSPSVYRNEYGTGSAFSRPNPSDNRASTFRSSAPNYDNNIYMQRPQTSMALNYVAAARPQQPNMNGDKLAVNINGMNYELSNPLERLALTLSSIVIARAPDIINLNRLCEISKLVMGDSHVEPTLFNIGWETFIRDFCVDMDLIRMGNQTYVAWNSG